MTENELLRDQTEHLFGPEEVDYGDNELVVTCLVRDGRPYVKSFVEHYLSLGAKHIAFLDNGSSDGTVEALRNYDHVSVVRTGLSYKADGGSADKSWTREGLFKRYIISRFGRNNRWCLYADIDELFDYPYSDVLGLSSFLGYLNSKSYTAVAAQMLDMFPEKPLSGRASSIDEPLKENHRYCDISNIKKKSMKDRVQLQSNVFHNDQIETFHNGIRDTLFGTSPYLTKFPLMFLDENIEIMNGSAHRVDNASIADLTCVLFHYKFIDQQFQKQVAQAVREEHRSKNSAKYKMYKEVLDRNPRLRVKQETARAIEHTNDLLEAQFLTVSDDYIARVDAEDRANARQWLQNEPSVVVDALLKSRQRERAKTLKIHTTEQLLLRSNEPESLRPPRDENRYEKGSRRNQDQLTVGVRAPRAKKRSRGTVDIVREREMDNQTEGFVNQTQSELLKRARPLFVCGCPRSGTTAFADYLNQQKEVLLCQERYKDINRKVTWDLFTFERIMDFRPEETKRPPGLDLERFVQRHAQILARKDPAEIKWIGDKGPSYVRLMDELSGNNPGARFIVLYRPLEEVAESWQARADNPKDPWPSERGFEKAVEIWNGAMRKTRRFIQSSSVPRVLVINYHDFFSRNEAVAPQIYRFLGLELDESVSGTWHEASLKFQNERRRKDSLSQEQRAVLEKQADRVAEAWVLDRIERQWREPGLYVEPSQEDALASLDEMEAMSWRLRWRIKALEHDLAYVQGPHDGQRPEEIERLRRQVRNLEKQLADLQGSRTWKLLGKLRQIRIKLSN